VPGGWALDAGLGIYFMATGVGSGLLVLDQQYGEALPAFIICRIAFAIPLIPLSPDKFAGSAEQAPVGPVCSAA
jgi:hypothetical protein